MPVAAIKLSGLSALDQEELKDLVGNAAEFKEPVVPEGTLAEPATITAIVRLGSLVIASIAAYGIRKRSLSKSVFVNQIDRGRSAKLDAFRMWTRGFRGLRDRN
jgi:hypothetical protein